MKLLSSSAFACICCLCVQVGGGVPKSLCSGSRGPTFSLVVILATIVGKTAEEHCPHRDPPFSLSFSFTHTRTHIHARTYTPVTPLSITSSRPLCSKLHLRVYGFRIGEKDLRRDLVSGRVIVGGWVTLIEEIKSIHNPPPPVHLFPLLSPASDLSSSCLLSLLLTPVVGSHMGCDWSSTAHAVIHSVGESH